MEEEKAVELKPSNSHATLLAASPLVGLLLKVTFIPWEVIIPLILWYIWKDEESEVALTGKKVLNGQITWAIFGYICMILMPIGIGWILSIPVGICWIIFTIINIVRVSKGNYEYQMPLSFTFFK